MYCHIKSYSSTSSGTRILPESRNLWQYPSTTAKGQLIPKAIYGLLTSSKKRMDKFVLFAFLLFMANKSNSSVHFLRECTAHQSAYWLYLTFTNLTVLHKEFGPLCKACNLEEEMDRNGSSPPLPRALNPTWKTLRFSHMKFNGPWAYLAALSFFEVDRRKQVEWIFNHTIRTKTFYNTVHAVKIVLISLHQIVYSKQWTLHVNCHIMALIIEGSLRILSF